MENRQENDGLRKMDRAEDQQRRHCMKMNCGQLNFMICLLTKNVRRNLNLGMTNTLSAEGGATPRRKYFAGKFEFVCFY